MEQNGKIIGNAEELQYILPGRTFHSTWASPEAFARHIEDHSASDCWERDNAYQSGNASFCGTETMQEAVNLAKNGWKEGAEKIEKLRSHIQSLYPKTPKYTRYGVAGTTPNVARAVAGNLFNMRLPEEGLSKKKPVITLVCNMFANWSVDKDAISNRAAAVAAIVDQIETEGFACEVISTALTSANYRGERGFSAATSIIIKQSHQPVDLMRMAFGLGHAAMFRRLIFADWQLEKSCEAGLGSGLGSACGSYSKEDLAKMAEKSLYFVPSAEDCSKFFKDDDASATEGIKFLMNALRKQGCPAFKKMTEDEKDKVELLTEDLDDDYDDDED